MTHLTSRLRQDEEELFIDGQGLIAPIAPPIFLPLEQPLNVLFVFETDRRGHDQRSDNNGQWRPKQEEAWR